MYLTDSPMQQRKNDGETFGETPVAGGAQQLITKRTDRYRSKAMKCITLKRQKASKEGWC
jgi:hypothetical protein